MSLKFSEMRAANVKRVETSWHPVNDWSPGKWLLAIMGEAGESCDAMKKIIRGDGTKEELAMELADVILYTDLLGARLEIHFHSVKDFDDFDDLRTGAGELPQGDEVKLMLLLMVAGANLITAPPDWEEINKRLIELLISVDYIAFKMEIDLGEAVRHKFNIVSDRVKSDVRL